jgi:hypothetical protein
MKSIALVEKRRPLEDVGPDVRTIHDSHWFDHHKDMGMDQYL